MRPPSRVWRHPTPPLVGEEWPKTRNGEVYLNKTRPYHEVAPEKT